MASGVIADKNQIFRFLFLVGIFSLQISLASPKIFAETKQWDFQNPDDYRFDSQKIKVGQGKAELVSMAPFRDADTQSLDKGTYIINTWAARGSVELVPRNIYPTQGTEFPRPLGGKESGLIALWHFDEPTGANLLDAVKRNIAKSSDAETVSGQTGFSFARLFDGNKSHVFVPHYPELALNGPFTIEAWIRPSVTVNEKPQTIISRWQTAGAQKSFAFQISPEGKLELLVSEDGATTIKHSGKTVLPPGVWHHVAAQFTGDDLRVFLNGVIDSEPTRFRGPLHPITNPIYFGAVVNNRLDEFFEGVIDEVSVFNRAISDSELLTHFGNRSGIVGLWHLNERGGNLPDASGYRHSAAAVNDPQYDVEGKLGSAMRFNGKNQYLETPSTYTLFPQEALTLEAWIRPESLPGREEYATVISVGATSGEYALALSGPEGRVGAFASGLSVSEVVGTTNLMPNVWQHVAAVWGQGSVRVYVNGILEGSAKYSGVQKFEDGIVRIASDAQQAALFKGTIDEPAIYRRAKSSEEIGEAAGLFPSGGIYLSSAKDAGTASPWRGFSWGQLFAYGTETSPAEKGLLYLYHLNEANDQQIQDEKGDNPATAVNTYAVPGIFSNARWFQYRGADKIISQKSFPALSTFTLSGWFQFASSAPGAADRLFSVGDESPTVFRGQDGRLRVLMSGARAFSSNKVLSDTRWHHIALVSDGRNLFLYIDGLLDGSSTVTSASAQAPLVLGNLKTTDTFQGGIDEVSFYNYALNRDTIVKQFLSGALDLKFLARSSDDPAFVNMSWKGPKGNNLVEEFPTASTVGLWHFNEKKFDLVPGNLQDAGRFANHGTFYGRVAPAPVCALSGCATFNGSSDYIEVPDSDSLRLNQQLTVSAWVYPEEIQEQGGVILDKHYQKGAPAFSSYALELTHGNRLAFRLGHPGGYHQATTDREGEVAVGRWNHVAATYNGKEVRLYINGQLKKIAPFESMIVYDQGSLYLGRYASAPARFFSGSLDEVAIDQKALSAEEVLTRFQKADPDNYFRGGQVLKSDFPRARYFQYQAQFATRFPMASPAFNWVEIQSSGYPSDAPFVINNMSISYADINSFKQKLGGSNKGDITYQFSNDGNNWFYHNGRRWVIASGAMESNTAAQIESRIRDFPKEVGIGSFYYKAFLHSPTALDPTELSAIELEYLPNKLTMSAPNGGESLLVGDSQVIRWNAAGEVAKVTLEYSKDNFQKDFHVIVKDTPNIGAFTWKVPDDSSPDVRVRVMDALDPRIHDTSDLGFRIGGSFELISPNWNETWEVGSTRQIIWKTTGKVPNVRLDYSTDEFTTQIFPIIASVKNEGHYEWVVPDHISASVKVRVADVRDPEVFDTSNDTFSITGNFAPLSPEPNARWIVGSEQELRWNTIGTIPAVKVEYKSAQSPDWKVIAESIVNQESMIWKVPDDISPEVHIRVVDPNEEKVYVETAPFAIIGGVRLIQPKGGENWSVGSRRKIAWDTIGTIPTVNIEYLASGKDVDPQWKFVEKSIVNTGSYVWEVPDDISQNVTVRISDSRDPFVQSSMGAPLKILPGFQLKSPNGGDSVRIDSEVSIAWDSMGNAPQVRLEYSKDNFASDIHTIIDSASNVGQYNWKVPNDASTNVRIRISDSSHPDASDISDAPFRIFGGFNFTIPKGGEKFEVGSLAALEWETLGEIPQVKIEYSRDDFNKDARTIIESVKNNGRFTWTVPDDIAAGYKVRISDVRDSGAYAISEGAFAIVGQFHLVQPAGGENLVAGSLSKIMWKAAGSVPFVRIDFSEDNFERSFDTVAGEAPNTGSFEWTVPNRIGKQFKLRIWDPSHPETMDVMSEPARIIGGFRLIQPNGGETFFVGEAYDLEWETFGTVPRVKIEFSNDNFQSSVSEIADTYENNGRYRWQVPATVSGNYKIRISDPSDVIANDISNADFKIRSKFILSSPAGGEGWSVGETRSIRWQTSGNVPEIKLEYSTNDFASSVTIADRIPNTGSYDWVIPNQVSANVKVRVSDVNDSGGFATSESPMRILGVIQLESPAQSEVWKVGEQREIRWKTFGDVKAVRVEYSRDGFSSEAKPIVESMANTGSLNWTVPDDIGPHTKVRVLDASEPATQAVSNAPFEIAPALAMLGPNGGEVWHATEKREINWVTIGTAKEVILELSKDEFATEPILIDRGILNQGRYLWDIPKVLGENFKMRVCDMENPKICDVSDKSFSIRSPFEMVYPKGGESWPVNTDQEIRWNTYGRVDRVMVEYSPDEKHQIWKKLFEELPNENHFLFKVPDDLSKDVIFRVSDLEDATLYAVSKDPVRFAGTLTLLEPNGGQKFAAGTMQTIAWDTIGSASNVRLEYSNDDFRQDIKLIEPIYPNTGRYEWKIPADLGVTVKVRVSDASNPEAFDLSDGPFKIMPGFTLLSPNGSEKWVVGSKQSIKWKTEGKSETVRLEYKINQPKIESKTVDVPQPVNAIAGSIPGNSVPTPKPAEWFSIVESIPNGSEYEWTVPDQVSKELIVRVMDNRDGDAFDVSDKAFEIRPDILVISPNGGEVFSVGLPAQIKWANIGTVGPVDLQYSKDGFQKDIQVIAQGLTEENYTWTPSDDVTAQAVLRVMSASDADVFDTSNQPFQILPSINVIVPAGGENWIVGTEQTINWDWRGSLDLVKIEYSVNDFISAALVGDNIPNSGNFKWQIPDAVGNKIKIKVSDAKNPAAIAVTKIPFNILPGFKVLAPNGNELWKIGETQVVKWETQGTSNRVRLDYGVPDGSGYTWKPIAKVARNSGSFDWQIPSDVSSQVKVRVTDALNENAFDLSDNAFKILARFKIISPAADQILPVDGRHQIRWETVGNVPSVKLEYQSYGRGAEPSAVPVYQGLESLWANTGSYYWSVPDSISEKVFLKISDANEPDAYEIIPTPFKIRGALKLGLGDTKVSWPIGSTQSITWKTTGTIPDVRLDYSTDHGKTWSSMIPSVANSGTYGWTVPDDSALNVKVRVSDTSVPEVFDESKEIIVIAPEFKITVPKTADEWLVGSEQTIEWKTTGRVEKLWLEYFVADKWLVIAGPMPDSGSFKWKVPDSITAVTKIRVRDGDNPEALAVSEPFAIRGGLRVNRPIGGEVLKVGSKETLHWETTGTIPKVRVEAWIDEENGENIILADNLDNTGRFEWVVPDKISNRLRVRVSDVRNPMVMSASPKAFAVIGSLKMVTPKADDILIVGSERELTWTSQGSMPLLNLEYSRDDFYRDINTIASGVANTGAARWTVPDSISNQVKIRISDANDSRAFALSEQPFKIKGALSVMAPQSGEIWTVGEKKIISWQSSGSIPAVRVEYSRDNFNRDVQVIENSVENKGSYEWVVPDVITSTLMLRVSSASDSAVQTVFEPVKVQGALRLNSPADGEVLRVLGEHLISWDTTGSIAKVRLEYSADDFNRQIHLITAETPNKGQWNWIVPDTIGPNFKLRVADASNFSVHSVSPAFEIQGGLALLGPAPDARWNAGSTQEINWQTIGTIPFVRLEYSKDEFVSHNQVIVDQLENRNKFSWQVPDDISDNVRVRISDIRNSKIQSVTPSPLKIQGVLKFLENPETTLLPVGTEHAIRWETEGTVPTVRLEYAVEGANLPLTWKVISSAQENKNEYMWKIPDDISNPIRIKISDARDESVYVLSSQLYSIVGQLHLLGPSQGERWIVGTSHDLVWNSVGSIPEVRLEYSRDRFQKDIQVILEKMPNTGRHLWTVPDTISNEVLVRVLDTRDDRVASVAPAPLTITGDFVITKPEVAATWVVGSEQAIEWQTIGTIPEVRLDYVRAMGEGQAPAYEVIQDKVPNEGRYVLHAPDKITEGLKIRVSDARDSEVAAFLPGAIKIEGALNFVSPQNGGTWIVGEQLQIEWATVGTIPTVALEYSTDDFLQDVQSIEPALVNSNRYTWNIPDFIHPSIKLRLRDLRDAKVEAVSSPFAIQGTLAMLKPGSPAVWNVGSQQELSWKAKGSTPTVRLEYSVDGFKNDRRIIEEAVQGDLLSSDPASNTSIYTYQWNVPDNITAGATFRVVDIRDNGVISNPSAPVKIQGEFTWSTPQTEKAWVVGGKETLSWKTTGTIQNVRLEYSRDGFKKDIRVITEKAANTGSYLWDVADAIANQVQFRVQDAADTSVSSVAPFMVNIVGAMKMTKPDVSSVWVVGTRQTLEWQTVGSIQNVKLQYVLNSQEKGALEFKTIENNLPNKGSFEWVVPDVINQNVQFKVLDALNPDISSMSPSAIEVTGALKITSPAVGKNWRVGDSMPVEWETTGTIPELALEYSADNFQRDVQTLVPVLSNKGRYLWTIPDYIRPSVQLRIRDTRDAKVYDVSGPFMIQGSLRILQPSQTSVWTVGSEQQIIWSSTGSIPRVHLEYSLDGFNKDIRTIEKNVEAVVSPDQNEKGQASYGHRWIVPDAISGKVSVRVVDSRDASVISLPSEFFKVRGDFAVLTPQGNETWITGTTQTLNWSTTGNIPFVRLQYSRDGFQKDIQLIADQLANTGTYAWQIPDSASDQVWVRVVDASDGTVTKTHTTAFRILGALKLAMPNAGDVWQVGSDQMLQWESSGTIPNVRIEYFSEPAQRGDEPVMGTIQQSTPNQGSYLWRIPDGLPAQVKIRVSSVQNAMVFSEFLEPVKLAGVIDFVTPGVRSVWPVNSQQKIEWQSQGVVPQVKLEYSRDQFTNDIGVIAPMIANQGSFIWTVPDIITKDLQLRISDVADAGVSARTRVPIQVVGSFDILSPQGGELWEVDSIQDIQWKTTGTIPAVKLEYSTDEFTKHSASIVESVPNTGRYGWKVPDAIAGQVRVKVSDVDAPEIFKVSAPFAVHGHLRLTGPRGGEIWRVGDTVNLAWETTGSIKQVKLEYSTDDFATSRPIVARLDNSGKYSWLVPDAVSDRVKIRVADFADSKIVSVLPQALKIQGVLKMIAPEGGEFWRVGTQHPLLWETLGSIPEVNLDYSSDNFQTTLPIVTQLPNQGRYTWTVPDIRADQLVVRVSSTQDQAAFAVIPKPVSVGGGLKLIAPAGGDVFKSGETVEVKWETLGTIPKVRLEISNDGFVNHVQVIEPSLSNSGIYEWKVPDMLYAPLQLRVSDASNLFISDSSKSPFKIAGKFNLVSPQGGESWAVGSRQNIRWETTGSVPEVRLEYSQNNFVNAIPIVMNLKNTGSYSWDVPDLAGNQIRFRISDVVDPTVFELSPYPTEIEGAFALTEPKGGEVWPAGDRKVIAWKTNGTIRNVNLEYSTDDFETVQPVAMGIANTGSYLWEVPAIKAKNLKIRLSSSENPKVSDVLKLGLQVQGKLLLLSPAGGEVWLAETDHAIVWQTVGQIEKVKIEFSVDGFRTVAPVVMELPNENRLMWKVPGTLSKQAQVRIQDLSDEGIFAVNEKPFEIRGALTLLSPVGGEIWTVGNRYPISWQTSGSVPQVRLEYSTDSFVADAQVIVPAMANNGVYYWEIPQLSANEAKVRVTDLSNPYVYDISREAFKVGGELSVLSPAAGEVFEVGQKIEIRWKSSPNIGNVRLEYSTDDFQTTTVISAFTKNTGVFPWSAPDKISDNIRVRVSDASNQLVFAFSKIPFSVHGGLQVISPKGGETWLIGSNQRITWNTSGSVPRVQLEYSTDGFNSAVPIAMDVVNSGSYDWKIPEIANKANLRVRVSDASRRSIFSESAGDVSIRGDIQILSPKEGDRWIVGEEKIIRWQTSGFIQKVDIEYSKDGFEKDIHLIASGAPNLGSYSWRVPHDLSSEARIRIRNPQDAGVVASTPAPFKIDLYKIRWMVKDAKTGGTLSGLMFSDSTGKTQSAITSPTVFEYPYGIYSTVWSKPGYGEFRSTWLADKDQTFSVLLEPKNQPVEMARANFEYDAARDLMNVTGWYEKDALPQPAVINCEIRIYDGMNLIKTLSSSNPDSRGYFRMIWDTSSVSGNARYLASAVITSASGAVLTSPISYQLDLPVKERREPLPPRVISSNYLKPLLPPVIPKAEPVTAAPSLAEPQEKPALEKTEAPVASSVLPSTPSVLVEKPAVVAEEKPVLKPAPAVRVQQTGKVTAPQTAVLNETISIHYSGAATTAPVVDVYDSNKKLIVRSHPMTLGGTAGTYTYLLPIKGIAFIPGKAITVNVIDAHTGQFQSAVIQIQTTTVAMGFDKQIGNESVLDVLSKLDEQTRKLKAMNFKNASYQEVMKAYQSGLQSLAGVLTVESVTPAVCQKVNHLSQELALIMKQKGYDGSFLTARPLSSTAPPDEVSQQVKNLVHALGMLQRLYQYSAA